MPGCVLPYRNEPARPTSSRLIALALALALLGLFQTACAIPLSGSSLQAPDPASEQIDRNAWIARVAIDHPTLEEKDSARDAFTLHLVEYVREAGYFESVSLLPGQPREDDVVLRFDFEHFTQVRNVDSLYFPLSLITFGFYPIFGGPVYEDKANLEGELAIETAAGEELASASDSISRVDHVSMWSESYALPSGIRPRTEIVETLLSTAIGRLD